MRKILENNYVGTGGSIFASLCCLGTSAILAFLSAIGLGFIINDFILFPLLALFMGISIYASFVHKKQHKNKYPLIITITSAILIIPAIFLSQIMAYFIIGALIIASIWDIVLKSKCKSCEVPK